jgi:hypothetical protein
MPFTRESIRAAVERAGDEHWQALIAHHEEAYPASPPTPGAVCQFEAERLNELGLGDAAEFELLETRVSRVGPEIEVTHLLAHRPLGIRLLTEPFRNYGPLA